MLEVRTMKFKSNFAGILFLSFCLNVFAQDIDYARYIIDSLASPAMFGRGYVNNGAEIAAKFISNEYSKLGLKSFDSNYYQPFHISVNTFPGKIKLKINNRELIPMTDYMVSSFSSQTFGLYKTVWFTKKNVASEKVLKKFLAKNYSDKVIVADKKGVKDPDMLKIFNALHYYNVFHSKGVLNIVDGKLMFDASPEEPKGGFFIDIERNQIKKKQEVFVQIENKFYDDYPTQNIIGYIKGKLNPDSFIVFSAHYDHLGWMGKGNYFPGANDNASGVAMVLNLAEYYSMPDHQPKNTMVFIMFAAEEEGLLGSKFASEHPLFPLDHIKFLVNLDLVGTGDEGIMVVNGAVLNDAYEKLVKINDEQHYLPQIKKRGEAANSDHYFFYEKKVPSFFIYTMGGINEYHNLNDKAETLPLTKFVNIVKLLVNFAQRI